MKQKLKSINQQSDWWLRLDLNFWGWQQLPGWWLSDGNTPTSQCILWQVHAKIGNGPMNETEE